jgi:hypothetical protein
MKGDWTNQTLPTHQIIGAWELPQVISLPQVVILNALKQRALPLSASCFSNAPGQVGPPLLFVMPFSYL